MARHCMLRLARRSALVLNVMGYLADEEVLAAARRRVFLDIDVVNHNGEPTCPGKAVVVVPSRA